MQSKQYVSTHWSKHPHPKVSSQQQVEDEHKCWTEEHSVVETRPEQKLSRPGAVCHYDRSQPKQSICTCMWGLTEKHM